MKPLVSAFIYFIGVVCFGAHAVLVPLAEQIYKTQGIPLAGLTEFQIDNAIAIRCAMAALAVAAFALSWCEPLGLRRIAVILANILVFMFAALIMALFISCVRIIEHLGGDPPPPISLATACAIFAVPILLPFHVFSLIWLIKTRNSGNGPLARHAN